MQAGTTKPIYKVDLILEHTKQGTIKMHKPEMIRLLYCHKMIAETETNKEDTNCLVLNSVGNFNLSKVSSPSVLESKINDKLHATCAVPYSN